MRNLQEGSWWKTVGNGDMGAVTIAVARRTHLLE
jgi:hypothetical protein